MERVTYREYMLWQSHFESEFSEPSRTDYYLMQIAQTICAVNAGKRAGKIKLKQFLLNFNREKTSQDKQEANKSAWKQIKAAFASKAK